MSSVVCLSVTFCIVACMTDRQTTDVCTYQGIFGALTPLSLCISIAKSMRHSFCIDRLLWGSTVGHPSNSWASCCISALCDLTQLSAWTSAYKSFQGKPLHHPFSSSLIIGKLTLLRPHGFLTSKAGTGSRYGCVEYSNIPAHIFKRISALVRGQHARGQGNQGRPSPKIQDATFPLLSSLFLLPFPPLSLSSPSLSLFPSPPFHSLRRMTP